MPSNRQVAGQGKGHPGNNGRNGQHGQDGQDGLDYAWLSACILETRGYQILEAVCGIDEPALRLDVVALDVRNLRLVIATTTTPRQRFGTLMMLLTSPIVAELCRRGVVFEVHNWYRRGDRAHVCEVLNIEPADFAE